MAIKEIFKTPDGDQLVGNLDWRLLPVSSQPAAALRAAAADRGATHAVSVSALRPEPAQLGKKTRDVLRASAGFSTAADDDTKKRKQHSLAAAFAKWSKEHGESLLCVKAGDGVVAIVVVINGMPVLDKVAANTAEAFGIVTGYIRDHEHISVFADDAVRFPSTLMHDGLLETIAGACGKETLIRPIPQDMVRVAIIALLVVGGAMGYMHFKRAKDEQAKREALLRAQADDPTNLYLQGLAQVAGRAGVKSPALQAAFEAALKIPTDVPGWKLTKVACAMEAPCAATFARTNGTFEELKADIPSLTLVSQGGTKLDEAIMTWKRPLDLAAVADLPPMQPLDKFVTGKPGSELQRWIVAGLSVQLQEPQLWPQVQGVPGNFRHPRAVASGKIEIGGLTLPFVGEVLTQAPKNVLWTGWQMEVGEAKQEPLARVRVRITGNYYVQN